MGRLIHAIGPVVFAGVLGSATAMAAAPGPDLAALSRIPAVSG